MIPITKIDTSKYHIFYYSAEIPRPSVETKEDPAYSFLDHIFSLPWFLSLIIKRENNKVNHVFNMSLESTYHLPKNGGHHTLQKLLVKRIGYERNILVLDNDFGLANLVKQILQKDNFKNVFTFTDPFLALEHFRINQKDYSLIISDIRMPTMNGFEFVREARKINPKVKILLMTEFEIDDREFVRVLPNPKIDGLIQKHASSKQILNIVLSITKDQAVYGLNQT